MRLKKIMWILGLTAALTFVGGCSGNTAEGDQQTQESEEGQEVMDTVPDEGAEAEPETGADTSPDESAGQEGTVSEAPVRIYGTIQEVGEDTITVDNQSGNSYEGEIILTIDPESTLIVDGQTGLPLTLADIEGGSFEAYLGSIMTMSGLHCMWQRQRMQCWKMAYILWKERMGVPGRSRRMWISSLSVQKIL